MIEIPPVNKIDIARSFSMAAKTYDQSAFIQKEIGQRLIDRLDLIKAPPQTILDVGAGTGFLTRQLQQKFPQSKIIGLDLAQGMMQFAKSKQPWQLWKNKPFYVCGDMEQLPFANQSFDLIFSNFTLQWSFALEKTFLELKRVLKPNGFLFFSTLGPQTLIELRQSWTDSITHVNEFTDMHDIGDALLKTRLNDPVMDMEMITVTYSHVKQLLRDLKATGARNMNLTRAKGLTAKNHFEKMFQAYEAFKRPDNLYPATFEVIYGHAWRAISHLHREEDDGIVRIPADKIPRLSV
ncbi:MAG: malonyl-[acyl-carrier protein] O-methyltransferase BioC [Gammaproteobacteria bacterium 39-13]|nr:malonyl-ACP O-methyltransferase BioC [Gammaproteobacteria bacterium]OJV88287.1 MAG: malonyl-[acyl-carrier protein] O-methyltransferase BioC [Gammaproteobacteria bacterium 39-13]